MICPLCGLLLEADQYRDFVCSTRTIDGRASHYSLFGDLSQLAYIDDTTIIFSHRHRVMSISKGQHYSKYENTSANEFIAMIKKFNKIKAFM